ncbi:7704_t:CDS:2 [Funneliformis caledonium]|uniref:7704_t:CDS:1 n=2 Tax=Funneliformis TaxID=1117308 RepID=A0A9N9EVP9_9GLOM|nr:5533_t:CDS:2 [Funneliformis mosseae]CAG8688737.1 7704_t:CDS:2 [Funneliformis caledonium]
MTTESKFPTLEFIKSEQLREIIQTKEVGKDYLIVDVRDDDYVGGNIPNCINKPSATIKDSLDSLISDYSQVPQIIFTCGLSKGRGPNSAKAYQDELLSKNINPDQKIQVLSGGITEWQKHYKDEQTLIENYDANYWNQNDNNVHTNNPNTH